MGHSCTGIPTDDTLDRYKPGAAAYIEARQDHSTDMTSLKVQSPWGITAGLALAVVVIVGQSGCGGLPTDPSTVRVAESKTIENDFGFHIHQPFLHWPTQSFNYWRVWDSGVDWARVEPQPGVFDFSLLDQFVALAEQHDIKLIYVLGNTPHWAATDPGHVGTQGLPGATSPPVNMQVWQNFIETLVTRYRGRIYAYEVWNEVDLPGYWTGSADQMLQMCRTAYLTIKQLDPAAFVLAPSLVAGNGIKYLSTFLHSGGANFTDAIPYHLYDTNRAPEAVIDFDQQAISAAQQFGKPIWDTEFGWGPWGSWTAPEAAAFLARSLILQSAQGITHIVWYAWDDRGPWVHLYLVGPDFLTPTSAATAFQQVTSWLIGSTLSCALQNDGSWQCPVSHHGGSTRYIVWNPNGAMSFTVPSSWNVSTVTNLEGNVQSLQGGKVQISSSPVLFQP